MDGSVHVVFAAYQNNLVSSNYDDVTSGSIPTPRNVKKVVFGSERVNFLPRSKRCCSRLLVGLCLEN